LTNRRVDGPYGAKKIAPLGLLRGRSEFPSFHDMLLCFIAIDSTVKVGGICQCTRQYKNSPLYQDTLAGSRGDRTLILLRKLLDANEDVSNYGNIFYVGCNHLSGELGVAVLSLFLSKNS
jgi:hypothetical protein